MKARWLWLAIPWAVFLALAIGWAIYWNVLAGGARARVEAWLAAEQARGAQASIGRIEAKGFPVLMRLDLHDIAYAPADGGWRASTAQGALHVQMFNPQHVIFEAGAPIAFTRDDGDVTNISADALIVSVRGADGALAQAGVEVDNLTLDDPAEAGVLSARKIVLNVRPDPRAAGDVQIAFEAQGLGLAQPVRGFEALGQSVEALRAAIVIEHSAALLRGAEGDPLAPWREAGGRMRFEALALTWGALQATGTGDVGLDDERRLSGALALPIEEPGALFRALAGGPEVEDEDDTRQALTLLSAAFAQSDQGLTLDVEAQSGVLRLEGLRTRTLPPVY
jgi:hypothetical protein